MPLWLRALEFAIWWGLFGGAAWRVCSIATRASRRSLRAGIVARIIGSLVLGAFGWFVGLYHVVTLGVIVAGDYRALLPSLGWTIWVAAVAAAAVPWLHLWFTIGRGRPQQPPQPTGVVPGHDSRPLEDCPGG